MNEDDSVRKIVDGFRRLGPEEQARAYLDIEKLWKAPQQHGTKTDNNPETLSE